MTDRVITWACGGGTQSSGIAALIVAGKLPKPELAYMVDVGWDKKRTWDYVYNILIPELQKVGVVLHILPSGPHFPLSSDNKVLIPAFRIKDGKIYKFGTRCSGSWKREVGKRWLRKQGVKKCINWVGISTCEKQRVKTSHWKWQQHAYPLIDLDMDRIDCIAFASKMGWPEPEQSSCVFCPLQNDEEWADLKCNYPEDWQRALDVESEIQQIHPDVFLHNSAVPLEEVELSRTIYSRECLVCGEAFTTNIVNRLCCTRACMKENKRIWRRNRRLNRKYENQLSLAI